MGNIYEELGEYEKAKFLFEQGLRIYKKHPSSNIAWALTNLGNIYRKLGEYEKAKAFLEQSVIIYKKYLPDNHVYNTWALINLGNIYKNLDQRAKAKNIFEKSLITYENHYGKDHIETAQILRNLGEIYLLEGGLEKAKDFFYRSLKIFQKSNHPDIYMIFEDLAQLYQKKSKDEKNKENSNPSLKTQALAYLKQALEILKAHFPADSLHIIRIQEKIKNLEEE